jgi:aryl-alcohol dehydrogenase-like predicted oxidoreductase
MRPSLERALSKLGLEYADVLLLGLWNRVPPARIRAAARELRELGLCRHLSISCHRRATFEEHIAEATWDSIMVRYNAAHPGAEEDVFPHLGRRRRPGVVAYTATCWGRLLDPRRTPPGEPTPRASDCYRFALSHPDVNLVLSGPKNAEQLDEAMAARDRGPMDPDELAWMKRVGERVHRIRMPAGLAAAAGIAERLRK